MINIQETILIRVLLSSPTGSQAVGRGYLTEVMLYGRQMGGHHLPQDTSEPISPAVLELITIVLDRC